MQLRAGQEGVGGVAILPLHKRQSGRTPNAAVGCGEAELQPATEASSLRAGEDAPPKGGAEVLEKAHRLPTSGGAGIAWTAETKGPAHTFACLEPLPFRPDAVAAGRLAREGRRWLRPERRDAC